jgi:hypothetical protein
MPAASLQVAYLAGSNLMAEASHSVHQAQIRAMGGAGTAIPPEGTTMNIIHLPTSLSSDEVKFAS